ncbi:hypothetical protein RvY_01670 [Ramazzottius varieornatus]|uniref:Uncharacterized protein n=1 Tax=Ramazzottius varieornatus TaxID=947166 RepID=A0A1D1UKZ3_RAMVA|nr:hypothetical protein RvY_01670 [Ramazzottius varieornatus]
MLQTGIKKLLTRWFLQIPFLGDFGTLIPPSMVGLRQVALKWVVNPNVKRLVIASEPFKKKDLFHSLLLQ